MTHIQRLRKWCEPVQEDTPVPSREHKIWVDRRDLQAALADYDEMFNALVSLSLKELTDLALERRRKK